ncbi:MULTISPECIES: hypothetical protein [Sphingobacterium]|uniref:hypothetical protein n=1 Tax=Sphingobacterium TaxID=28453 RepID=UPI0013D9EFF4|nr:MULTISPECIES: hypothetical protein [unclassified Sphingobacterium]
MKTPQNIFFKTASVLLYLLLASCNNQTDTKSRTVPTQQSPYSDSSNTDAPLWEYDYQADTLIRIDSNQNILHSIDKAISIINKSYEGKVNLKFVGQNTDTLIVKIEQSQFLTEQMGSAGARAYLALATFTLTEQTGIKYVTFDFQEGDHASPGTYNRLSFKN